MTRTLSRGKALEHRLHLGLQALRRGFADGARERPISWGVTGNGTLVSGMTLDLFMAQAAGVLRDSGRVYRWDDTIVFESGEQPGASLLLLSMRGKAEPHAAGVLTNLFGAGVQDEQKSSQSLMPARLVNALLADEELSMSLPAIRVYAQRAVYDDDFHLCGPGWHPDRGILVHGPDIAPAPLPPVAPAGPRSIDRLPLYLRRLLGDFCFESDADLENALALLLTGLLANHFISSPKPMGLIDGNQQEVGKTLLCQAVGQVLDGREPERIPLVRDDELEKKVGAKLRESASSIFFFDNLKAKVDSAFLEANALSPLLSVRRLGHSRNINRPNSYLWLVTSNLTTGSSDTISRGVPIRLRYYRNPVDRKFKEDLLEYATRHRMDILGELAAMVERWRQVGRPDAHAIWPAGSPPPRHRCQRWVQIVGGILAANGYTNFLVNVEEAKAAMDEGLQALATLAEHVVAKGLAGFINPASNDSDRGKLPREWASLFVSAGVFREKLADKNARGRDTWVGTFLSGKTDRTVGITVSASTGTAVLRRNPVRNDQKRYYFEVNLAGTTPDSTPTASPQQSGGGPGDVVEAQASAPAVAAAAETVAGGGGASEPPTGAGVQEAVLATPAGNNLDWV